MSNISGKELIVPMMVPWVNSRAVICRFVPQTPFLAHPVDVCDKLPRLCFLWPFQPPSFSRHFIVFRIFLYPHNYNQRSLIHMVCKQTPYYHWTTLCETASSQGRKMLTGLQNTSKVVLLWWVRQSPHRQHLPARRTPTDRPFVFSSLAEPRLRWRRCFQTPILLQRAFGTLVSPELCFSAFSNGSTQPKHFFHIDLVSLLEYLTFFVCLSLTILVFFRLAAK